MARKRVIWNRSAVRQVTLEEPEASAGSGGGGPPEASPKVLLPKPKQAKQPPAQGAGKGIPEPQKKEEMEKGAGGGQPKPEEKPGEKKPEGQKSLGDKIREEAEKRQFDKHDYAEEYAKAAEAAGEEVQKNIPEEQWKKAEAEAEIFEKEAFESGKAQGYGGGMIGRSMKKESQPVVNWRALLREYLKEPAESYYTYRKLHKYAYATGAAIPGTMKQGMGKLQDTVIAVDVSGSVSDVLYTQFISEIAKILKLYKTKIRIVFFDDKVYEDDIRFIDASSINKLKEAHPRGYGGTNVNVVTEFMKAKGWKPRVFILMTDGYVNPDPVFDKMSKKLFIVSDHDATLKPFGRTVRMYEDEERRRQAKR